MTYTEPNQALRNTIASPPHSYQYRETFLLLGSALLPAPPERPDLESNLGHWRGNRTPEQWLFVLGESECPI